MESCVAPLKSSKGFSLAEVAIATAITVIAGIAIFEIGSIVMVSHKKVEADREISSRLNFLKRTFDSARQCNANFAGKTIDTATGIVMDVGGPAKKLELLNPDNTIGPPLAMPNFHINSQLRMEDVNIRVFKNLDESHKALSIDFTFEHIGKTFGNSKVTQSIVVFVEVDPGSNVIANCNTIAQTSKGDVVNLRDIEARTCAIVRDRSVAIDRVTGECKPSPRVPCTVVRSSSAPNREVSCPLDGKVAYCVAWDYGDPEQVKVSRAYADGSYREGGPPDVATEIINDKKTCKFTYALGVPVAGHDPKLSACCTYPELGDGETDFTDLGDGSEPPPEVE